MNTLKIPCLSKNFINKVPEKITQAAYTKVNRIDRHEIRIKNQLGLSNDMFYKTTQVLQDYNVTYCKFRISKRKSPKRQKTNEASRTRHGDK